MAIEQICFPPHEACSEKHMKERIAKAPELFLVAVDKETGRLAGFLNGLSTKEQVFRDEFFLDANLYDPAGECVMLLGLCACGDDIAHCCGTNASATLQMWANVRRGEKLYIFIIIGKKARDIS